MTKVAFPNCDLADVDAALEAGNNLRGLDNLACGRSLAKDFNGQYKQGGKWLKILRVSRLIVAAQPRPKPEKATATVAT